MSEPRYDPHTAFSSGQPQIDAIMALLGRVSEKFEPESAEAWAWMARRAADPAVAELLLHDLTITSARVLDQIGAGEPVNGITIARQSGVPRGTVSKTARRLIAQRLVETERLPDNRKEVLFRLTPLGRQVFEIHRAFDLAMAAGFAQFLRRYDAEELSFLIRLLNDLLDASFLADGE